MKKLVIKVVLISLAAIIAIFSITYLLLSILSPISLAKFYGNIGSYKVAVGFCEKQYEKDGNIDNIVLASDYAAKLNDDGLVVKYAEMALGDDEYATYSVNNEKRTAILLSHYIKAKYELEGGNVATEQAFKYLVGYKSHNIVETLMVSACDKNDKQTLSLIKERLEALDKTNLSELEQKVLQNDILVINSLL